eukprot:11478905-Alexandrium_andersonii.AAC.1
MSASLVGSEMCIRDSAKCLCWHAFWRLLAMAGAFPALHPSPPANGRISPVSYTHLTLPTICSV